MKQLQYSKYVCLHVSLQVDVCRMAAWLHLQGVVTPAAQADESEEVTGDVQKQQGNSWY